MEYDQMQQDISHKLSEIISLLKSKDLLTQTTKAGEGTSIDVKNSEEEKKEIIEARALPNSLNVFAGKSYVVYEISTEISKEQFPAIKQAIEQVLNGETKQYTEDDLKKAFISARETPTGFIIEKLKLTYPTFEDYKKSLKKNKYP